MTDKSLEFAATLLDMNAQDIIPNFEAVVSSYDVNILLCAYGEADIAVEDIVTCIARHTSPKWARGVEFIVKEIVDGVVSRDPELCSRVEKYCFVFDKEYFLGYDASLGVVLRRRA